MKTKAAVLYKTGAPQPFAESLPFVIDEITLAGPERGEVLVEIVGADCAIRIFRPWTDLARVNSQWSWDMSERDCARSWVGGH